MSELAFDKEGNPFRFSRRARKLRPRRWKNAGQRGTCAAVLDPDGEQLLVDADAEYAEFRAAVGNVPGFYRLDQCDEGGALIEDAPPAYVSIESVRNSAPVGEIDSRDALIRDLAQINAEMTRTIVERFSNVMQAAADVLRAADGAGLPRREPLPAAPLTAKEEEDDDSEEEEDDDDNAEGERYKRHPTEIVWSTVEPMIPMIGAWLSSVVSQRLSKPTPGAPAPAAPAPAGPAATAPAATTPAATTPAPAGLAPDPVVPGPASAVSTGLASAGAAPAASAPGAPASAPASAVGTPASSAVPIINQARGEAAPTTEAPTAEQASIAADMPPGTAPGAGSAATGAAIVSAAPAEAGQLDAPRNALPVLEPTPEQWAHLYAIRARLSPREAAIAQAVVVRMPAELRAQWLAELSLLSVEEATEAVRSMIPKSAPKQARARKAPEDDGQEEG